MINVALMTVFFGLLGTAQGQALLPKQILILQTGTDELWGEYMFGLENQTGEPQEVNFKLALPMETTEWTAGQGLPKEVYRLGDDGGVNLVTTLEPGSQFSSLRIRIPAKEGVATLTIPPMAEGVAELGVWLSEKSKLLLSDRRFLAAGEQMGQMGAFSVHTTDQIKAGQAFEFHVEGVSEGRGRLWTLGAIVSILVAVLGGFLALKTKPSLAANEEVAL